MKTFIQDANYNGKTLIGNITGSNPSATCGRVATVRNDSGATYGIATFGGSALYGSIALHRDSVGVGAATVAGTCSPRRGTFITR